MLVVTGIYGTISFTSLSGKFLGTQGTVVGTCFLNVCSIKGNNVRAQECGGNEGSTFRIYYHTGLVVCSSDNDAICVCKHLFQLSIAGLVHLPFVSFVPRRIHRLVIPRCHNLRLFPPSLHIAAQWRGCVPIISDTAGSSIQEAVDSLKIAMARRNMNSRYFISYQLKAVVAGCRSHVVDLIRQVHALESLLIGPE